MKQVIYLVILLLCSSLLKAQSDFTWMRNKEGKMIAVPKRATFNLNMPEFSYFNYKPSERQLIEAQLRKFIPDLPVSMEDRPMDMMIGSAAYQPFFNIYAPMIRRVSPMSFDFAETSFTPLSDNLTFLVTGQQYTWPGMGGLTRINPELVWHKDRLTISGGAFGGRYFTPFNPSPLLMGGFNVMGHYEVNDLVAIRAWGQYAFYGGNEQNNPHMLMNPFYNHTSVGGALEFKVTEDFKIGAGVNFEFNPVRGKMEPQYMIYPAGKMGRFKFGVH